MGSRGIWVLILLMPVVLHVDFYRAWQPLTREKFGYELRDVCSDFADINFQLFSKESFLVLCAAAPFYAVAHGVDHELHAALYDAACHKNTFDIGCCREYFAEDIGVVLPLVVLGCGCWISSDYQTRLLGRNLLVGLSSVGIARTILKDVLDGAYCYRPYSGCFKQKLVLGGFPSGHAASLLYATILLGLQKGALWAIPVGAYSTCILASLLMCNYHYVSQLVAGTVLGALYAVAAHAVITQRINDRIEFNLGVTQAGQPMASLVYAF